MSYEFREQYTRNQPLIRTREIALDNQQLIDLCHTTRAIVETTLLDPQHLIENTVILEDIPHDNTYTTPGVLFALRGTAISKLNLSLWRNEYGTEQLTVKAIDRDHPDREITLQEFEDSEYMLIHDNRHNRVSRINRGTEMSIPKTEVAHWLALQARRDSRSSFSRFLRDRTSLYEAARLLEIRAATKNTADVAGLALLSGTMLNAQKVASHNPSEPLAQPNWRHYSAWLTSTLPNAYLPDGIPNLTQRLVISFCPETGVVGRISDATTDTTVRLELETDTSADKQALETLLTQTAQRAEKTILEVFKGTAAAVGVMPTRL